MSTAEEILILQKRARDAGFRVADILRVSGVDRSTWTRWRNDTTSPRLDNWRAVNKAVDDLINSKVEQTADSSVEAAA
jgi:RPA family protein